MLFSLLITAGALMGLGGLFVSVSGLMKSSDAYSGALARVRASSAVIETIGAPVRDGIWVTGSINVNGPSGSADLAIPVSGPKGKATVYVVATKTVGAWRFDHLIVEVDETGRRIDISGEQNRAAQE